MTTITRTSRVSTILTTLAILALTFAPVAAAAEPQPTQAIEQAPVWSTIQELIAPIGDWFLEVVALRSTIGTKDDSQITGTNINGISSQPISPRRLHADLDPIG